MKKIILSTFAILSFVFSAADESKAAAKVGEKAPEIKAVDSNGEEFNLSNYEGNIVVLEWTNKECPFVVKHYKTDNMQNLQKKYAEKDVVWVTVVSSAPGKQGHLESGEEANKVAKEQGAEPTHIIRDESGEIGKAYGAKTTPHMYVIDAQGMVAYMGAIDSISSADSADVEKAENYVVAAIDSLIAGEKVETAVTTPYGCGVKY